MSPQSYYWLLTITLNSVRFEPIVVRSRGCERQIPTMWVVASELHGTESVTVWMPFGATALLRLHIQIITLRDMHAR